MRTSRKRRVASEGTAIPTLHGQGGKPRPAIPGEGDTERPRPYATGRATQARAKTGAHRTMRIALRFGALRDRVGTESGTIPHLKSQGGSMRRLLMLGAAVCLLAGAAHAQ